MGLGGISIWQLLIVLAIVMLVFGTKRLKGLGGDLGGAMKGFKQAMKDNSDDQDAAVLQPLEKAGSDSGKAT
jgi:sec-independent protein translocase protein TatA